MPVYFVKLTTPANTLIASETFESVVITPGILERVIILIPAGHSGLTFTRILYNGRQIIPNTFADYMQGGNIKLEFDINLEVKDHPNRLAVSGFNLDDTFEHSTYVWFEVETSKNRLDLFKRLI